MRSPSRPRAPAPGARRIESAARRLFASRGYAGTSMAEIAAAAQKKGMKVFPIMFGRAKAMLGLVPSAPRGAGKATRKKAAAKAAKAKPAAAAAPTGARRGRPRKAAAARMVNQFPRFHSFRIGKSASASP